MYRFLPRCNESALHLAGSEDSYAELGGGAGRGSPEEFGASWRGTLRRGRWVRLCAFPVVCGVGGSEEPLGACGARSGVHFPCPLWALTRYTLGRTGTGSVSPQRWRGSCGDKGFRDAALRRGAAPEPAVLPRGRRPSLEQPSSAPVPVVIEWLPAGDKVLGPLRGQLPNLEQG